jgi:DNA polymerase
MPKVWLDFETYSKVDIRKQGGYVYTHDSSTEILCLAYAIDDRPVDLWLPGTEVDEELSTLISNPETKVYAHNAKFDFRIWNNKMPSEWPRIKETQLIDTMALCASFSLPLSLADAGSAMSISMPKDSDGKALIRDLCKPTKLGTKPDIDNDPQLISKFNRLCRYCLRDVEAMRSLVEALPRDHLIGREALVWLNTLHMNSLGLPIDHESAKAIKSYLAEYVNMEMKQVNIVSGGDFQTINQIAKIKAWCLNVHSYPIDNLQASTITEILGDASCPEPVKKIMCLRQELGRTSTAKYTKVIDQLFTDEEATWVKDNLVYFGASTGRWTGTGFQMHNLPRASVKDPKKCIADFKAGCRIDDPVGKGKALIRPMIKAPPGQVLIVSDYSGVENRALHWVAGDLRTLEDFKNGIDQYITMASARYGKSYEEIKDGYDNGVAEYESMRFMGKVIILGCGYGMGKDTFIKTAKLQFGLEVSEEGAQEAVDVYRHKFNLIPKLWKGLKTAAAKAVLNNSRVTYGRITFGTARVKGTTWLAMKLPSGRCIYYKNPQVEERLIPKFEYIGPVPTVTHEGRNPLTRKWGRVALIPGRITENAVQGFTRDIMAQGLLNVENFMPSVRLIGTVHDEALGLISKDDVYPETLETFNALLCAIDFAEGLPLQAKGFIAKRYKK